MCGIPIDIQVRNFNLPTFEKSLEGLKKDLESIVAAYDLQDLTDWESIFEKWDAINQRDNSFLVSAHLVSAAFEENVQTYFRKPLFKELIKNELKLMKYDFDDRAKSKKKGEADTEEEIQEINSYFDFCTVIQAALTYMATNRSMLFEHLNKTYDFVFAVHTGTKLHDQKNPASRALYLFPMEVALWMAYKKFEIGFEGQLWPHQLMPYTFHWMMTILVQYCNNREAYIGKFSDTTDEVVLMNQLIYKTFDDRKKRQVSNSLLIEAKVAFLRAMCQMMALLDKEGLIKRFMTEKELMLGYDAKILTPYKDYFFLRRPTFAECTKSIQDQISAAPTVNCYLLRLLPRLRKSKLICSKPLRF